MAPKLTIRIIEARNLAAMDSNGLSDPFVRVQLGKSTAKTPTIYKNLNPVWNDEFIMKVEDADNDVVEILVWDQDFLMDDFLGQVLISVKDVMKAESQIIHPTWYPLQKKSQKSKMRVSGDILVGIALWNQGESISRGSSGLPSLSSLPSTPLTPRTSINSSDRQILDWSTDLSSLSSDTESTHATIRSVKSTIQNCLDKVGGGEKSLVKAIIPSKKSVAVKSCDSDNNGNSIGNGNGSCNGNSVTSVERSESTDSKENGDSPSEVPSSWFDEDHGCVPSKGDLPPLLLGGTVVDHPFGCSAKELNALIFKPDSEFWTEWTSGTNSRRKLASLNISSWRREEEKGAIINRVMTYMTPPSSLVKSVLATETYTYARADSGGYVVEVSVATPDVPYGNTFLTQLQYRIAPIGENASRLVISWSAKFLQSTMMRGMIENGMRNGIGDTYKLFLQMITEFAPPYSEKDVEERPVALEEKKEVASYSFLFNQYLDYGALGLTLLFLVLLPVHFMKSASKWSNLGLEFWKLDLPDSLLELLIAAIIVFSAERTVSRLYHFIASNLLKRGDHGLKANGNGWLITITLLEAENLPATGFTGLADPYVIFTCNGKTRTSSVKLQSLNPSWNEMLEFDAFDDPPSTMDVEIFDYDGPFATSELIGRTEINFLKHSTEDDMWVPLEGRRTKSQPRLHLRVVLSNTSDKTPKFLEELEKETGTKMGRKKTQKNAAFQKLFSLPENELLINDFTCAVKKSLPLQGRLFVSNRMLGFFANLFGIRTHFTLLWEDIEDIKEHSPAMGRFINPNITIYLKKGKGLDAKVGSYGLDSQGRMKIRFFSFVRPNVAFRTVEVLWKNRLLPVEQQLQKVEEANASLPSLIKISGSESQVDDNSVFLGAEPAKMEEVALVELPVTVEQVLDVVQKKETEVRVSEQLGMTNFLSTEWEEVEDDAGQKRLQRSTKYVLSRQVSSFGSSISAFQQKYVSPDGTFATLEEAITMHNVPFGDHFRVETRRSIQSTGTKGFVISEIKAEVGIAWHKETETKEKITRNILEFYKKHLRSTVDVVVQEIIAVTQGSVGRG